MYRATRPPKLVGRTKTDDRGAYRFGGLEPGLYLVRNLARQIDEETGLLPTFYKEVAPVEDAAPVQVTLDEQAADINVRPLFGRLCQLTGVGISTAADVDVSVRHGRDGAAESTSSGRFTFENLAPGTYELIATGTMGRSQYGAYQKITIERDREVSVNLSSRPGCCRLCWWIRQVSRSTDGRPRSMARRTTLGRRREAATRLRDGVEIQPGRWEVSVQSDVRFLSSFDHGGWARPRSWRTRRWVA